MERNTLGWENLLSAPFMIVCSEWRPSHREEAAGSDRGLAVLADSGGTEELEKVAVRQ